MLRKPLITVIFLASFLSANVSSASIYDGISAKPLSETVFSTSKWQAIPYPEIEKANRSGIFKQKFPGEFVREARSDRSTRTNLFVTTKPSDQKDLMTLDQMSKDEIALLDKVISEGMEKTYKQQFSGVYYKHHYTRTIALTPDNLCYITSREGRGAKNALYNTHEIICANKQLYFRFTLQRLTGPISNSLDSDFKSYAKWYIESHKSLWQ